MKILYKNISDISENQFNPNVISDSKFKTLVRNIKDDGIGFLMPVIIDSKNVIIDGAHRFRACKEAGLKKIQCVIFEGDEKKKKLLTLAMNNIHGENDQTKLEALIADLSKGFDADKISEITGMSEVDDIIQSLKYAGQDGVEDEVPEVDRSKVFIQAGDLIEMGEHRVLCGDSMDKTAVEKLMGGEKADVVFTDPPYGVSIGDKNKLLDTIQKAGRVKTNIKNDTLSPEKLKEILVLAFKNLKDVSNDRCSYFVTSPQGGGLGMMMMMMMMEAGLPVRHVIIWVKDRQCFSMGRLDYEYKHEPILYTWNKTHKFYAKGKHRSSIWEIKKEQKCKLHPTMKPVELIENALLNNSKVKDICADFFGGSGSTLIACEKTGRKCRMMEIDPWYCQIILERWCQYTGSDNVKINGKVRKIEVEKK